VSATTREELHHLIDALPERTLDAAEAFLAFLRDRAVAARPQSELLHGTGSEPTWAADERRGLEERRQQRDATDHAPDPDDMA
jgi:hypothetical protein